MPLYYHGSKTQDVEEMHLAHLDNAVKKIERMGPSHEDYDNLDAIRAVYDRRKAEWDEAHPAEG